jgi:hypothetical protein
MGKFFLKSSDNEHLYETYNMRLTLVVYVVKMDANMDVLPVPYGDLIDNDL